MLESTTHSLDIEIGLSEEDLTIRDTAHKFAEEVMRPAGIELDRMNDPADVIASGSVLWEVYRESRSSATPRTSTSRATRFPLTRRPP